MRQEHKRKMRKQMGRRYLAILCIIAIFCTSIPITTTQTQARAYTDWEVFETNTGEPVAAAYGNGVFALLNNAGVFYISDDAMTWTQTGLLPGTNGETNDTYKMLQMKFINNAFYLYGIKGIFLRSVDGKVWERIDFGNRLVTAMTYGDNAWYLASDGENFSQCQYQDMDSFALWRSQDGKSFTQIETEADIKACNSLCCAQNKLIVTDPVANTINTLPLNEKLSAKSKGFLIH